jgi:hypothetical protein
VEPVLLGSQKINAQRRSQRVMLSVHVLVSGISPTNKKFSEDTFTAVVNAHGALILLTQAVKTGELLTIRNIKSGEEQTCSVVGVGASHGTQREVGIEFLNPSPRFWRIAFPPEDWSPRSPEAKQFSGAPTPIQKRATTK